MAQGGRGLGRDVMITRRSGRTVCDAAISTNEPLLVADPGVVTVLYSTVAIQRHSLRYRPIALLPYRYLLMLSSATTNHSLTWCQLEKLIVMFEALGYVGRMWLILKYVGESEILFRWMTDGSGESDRLFHSLRKRLDQHVFPLL